MKKLFSFALVLLATISLFFSPLKTSQSHALESSKSATVIASRCLVYTSPDFQSETLKIENSEEKFYLYHNDVVELAEISGDFAKVTKDETEGWVYKFYLTQNSSQTVYPVFNCTVRRDTVVLDMDLGDTPYQLKKGDRVYLYQKYDGDATHTPVQMVLEDGTLYNGYVLTDDLDPDGFSGLVITAISIIAAAVTIVLAIVFIKKKKKSK